MDIRKIKKLIDLIDESSVAEIEIREGEQTIRVSRLAAPGTTGTVPAPTTRVAGEAAAPPGPTHRYEQAPEAVPETAAEDETPSGHVVKSPMVGTFYAAPSPGARPFVEVGQSIDAGETLCIVEAMKMLNQIEADVSGVIKAILIENGQPVEFDQPLFVIE